MKKRLILLALVTTLAFLSMVVGFVGCSKKDVYVAGYEINSQGRAIATLWKNGVPHNLSTGQTHEEGNAVLWKNGKKTVLGKWMAKCVFVK